MVSSWKILEQERHASKIVHVLEMNVWVLMRIEGEGAQKRYLYASPEAMEQASARCEVDFEAQNKHADASGHLLKLLHLSWIYDVDGNRAPNTKSAGWLLGEGASHYGLSSTFLNVGVLKDQARQENADSYVMAAEISNNRSCDVAKGLSSALGVAKKHENGGRLVFEKRPGSHVHCIWDFWISPSPYHVRWTILRKQRHKNILGLHSQFWRRSGRFHREFQISIWNQKVWSWESIEGSFIWNVVVSWLSYRYLTAAFSRKPVRKKEHVIVVFISWRTANVDHFNRVFDVHTKVMIVREVLEEKPSFIYIALVS
jgi:hypothetical protein